MNAKQNGYDVSVRRTELCAPSFLLDVSQCELDELAIINKREWNNCSIKNVQNMENFFLTIFVKITDFQLVFNFEQTRTVTIFGEHGIMAHTP